MNRSFWKDCDLIFVHYVHDELSTILLVEPDKEVAVYREVDFGCSRMSMWKIDPTRAKITDCHRYTMIDQTRKISGLNIKQKCRTKERKMGCKDLQ